MTNYVYYKTPKFIEKFSIIENISNVSNNNIKDLLTKRFSTVVDYPLKNSKIETINKLNKGDLNFAYLVGLIEGDGWFSITKNGKYLKYEFGIELNIRDIQLLYKIKNILGVGLINIRKRSDNEMCIFRIRNKSHLKDIIIPIFDKYPMLTNKQYDFLFFKESLLANIILFEKLPVYTRPEEPFNTIEKILNTSYYQAWLVGFIEAESCFSVYKPTGNNSLVASFDIAQKDSFIIIESIREFLSLTPKVYKDKNNCFRLKVSSIEAINNIVKFLDKAPVKLMGYKKLQYLLWLKELRKIPKYSNNFKIPDIY